MKLSYLSKKSRGANRVFVPVLASFLMLSACAGLPVEGPKASDVVRSHEQSNTSGFVLIDLNNEVADYLKRQPKPEFSDRFGKGKPSRSGRIGVGDSVSVQVWEADPAGLFSSAGSVNRGLIPESVVDRSGYIQVPFAGSVKAAGRTPRQLAKAIERKLSDKTVQPQVHVTITKNVTNTVTITGDVNRPSVVPLSLKGDDLLDVLAAAGGAKHASYASLVTLTRGNTIGRAYLSYILNSPRDNVYLRGGDNINIEFKPQTFSAFGAVDKKGRHDFTAARLSVLEAIGMVSGLSDRRADPRGVFLMRFEDARIVRQLAKNEITDNRKIIPVIYRIDLKDPNQYFFAQVIGLHDKDIIYVANAPSVEIDKFLTIVGKAVGASNAVAGGVVRFGGL